MVIQQGDRMSLRISFPIATYNRPEILVNRTLPSILNQEYKNLDIVIVCDGNKNAFKFIKQNIKDNRVRIYNLKKRTEYPNDPFSFWCVAGYRPRNIAAKICNGNWLWWISDDDEIIPGSISIIAKKLELLNKNIKIYTTNYLNEKNQVINPDEARQSHWFDFVMTGMPSLLIRKEISNKYRWSGNCYNNKVNRPSDYDLLYRITREHNRIAHDNIVTSKVNAALPNENLQGSAAFIKRMDKFI